MKSLIGFILVLGRQNVDWCFWNWYRATLVTDLFFSNDISRDYWFIFNYKSRIRIIYYICNVPLIITFNWFKQCKISPVDKLSIWTYFLLPLSMLLPAHTKRLNDSVYNNFHLLFLRTLPCYYVNIQYILKNVLNFPNDIQY